jgi:siderophore synthetase component
MATRDTDSLPSPRTDAEWDAFSAAVQYVRTTQPSAPAESRPSAPAESRFLEALPEARSDITRRFVRGLLRGEPAGMPAPVLVTRTTSTVPDEPAPLSALDGEQLRAAVGSLSSTCRSLALLPFPATGTVVVAPVAAIHGYDRFRFAGPVRRWTADARDVAPVLDHPVDLVSLLDREGAFVDAAQAETIRREVEESVANLALAQLARPVHASAVDSTVDSGLDRVAAGIPAASASAAFERIVTDGHPFHPGGKIRRGMTPADGIAYAPEFTDRIDLRFVAVRRAYALETRATGAARLTDRLCSMFDGLRGAFAEAIPGGDTEDYAVVPVHPWQYHHTIRQRYADQRADGRVVPIHGYSRPATPQLNLRTVVPYRREGSDESLPHLKLAIDVQTTNVVRTLSPQAVTNGPRVTDLLRAVATRESFGRLGLVREPAATCYFEPGGPHVDGNAFDDARHLSGLVRSPPSEHSLVPDGATPVVASSLLATAPSTGRPLVCDCLDAYAATTGTTDRADAALEFLSAYAATVIPEQLLLLSKYGIALESHLQNSLLVFDDGRPVATLVRDFGGIRVCQRRLGAHGLSIDPYPDSDLDAADESDLYGKLYYALFQNHLAELIATLVHETDADEAACWRRVRDQCERAFDVIRSDPDVPERRVRRDEAALFDDSMVHKALTAMRLRGKRHEYVTSQVSNPLAVDPTD